MTTLYHRMRVTELQNKFPLKVRGEGAGGARGRGRVLGPRDPLVPALVGGGCRGTDCGPAPSP